MARYLRRQTNIATALIVTCALLAGCVSTPSGRVTLDPRIYSRDSVFPLGAGIFGALLCNQLFKNHGSRDGWTAACGVGGYLLGRNYTQHANEVLERNRVGHTSTWQDPDGYNVRMTPTDTWDSGGGPCRSYRTVVEIDGQEEILIGKACRKPDGSWEAQS